MKAFVLKVCPPLVGVERVIELRHVYKAVMLSRVISGYNHMFNYNLVVLQASRTRPIVRLDTETQTWSLFNDFKVKHVRTHRFVYILFLKAYRKVCFFFV